MLITEPTAKNVVRFVGNPAAKIKAIYDAENSNFTRRAVRCAEMNSGDEQKCVTLIKLTELRVLPRHLLHVVLVFDCGRVARSPKRYTISFDEDMDSLNLTRPKSFRP